MGEKYISDYTRFIAELKSKDPGIEEGQRAGRAIFWDKRIDLAQEKRFHESELAQPAYVYQNRVGPEGDDDGKGASQSGEISASQDKVAILNPGDVRTPGTPAANKP
jgi:hypothetical protein